MTNSGAILLTSWKELFLPEITEPWRHWWRHHDVMLMGSSLITNHPSYQVWWRSDENWSSNRANKKMSTDDDRHYDYNTPCCREVKTQFSSSNSAMHIGQIFWFLRKSSLLYTEAYWVHRWSPYWKSWLRYSIIKLFNQSHSRQYIPWQCCVLHAWTWEIRFLFKSYKVLIDRMKNDQVIV